jgi:hypothetical protein
MRMNMKKYTTIMPSACIILLLSVLLLSCGTVEKKHYYQGITTSTSYSYDLSGRTDRIKGYIMNIPNTADLNNPGLVLISNGIDLKGEAYVMVNDNRYELPPILEDLTEETTIVSDEEQGKIGWYTFSNQYDIVGKIVVPLDRNHLKDGINQVEFFKKDGTDGYNVIDVRIESVTETGTRVVNKTYRDLARGKSATIDDFDFVVNYHGQDKRMQSEVPEWTRTNNLRFYRAGIDFDNLDRMFEMFKEARINLVMIGVPADTESDQYNRIKAFIDRCHDNGINVTASSSLGGISLSNVILNPKLKEQIARDEYGELRWRRRGGSYLADLNNPDYHKDVLHGASVAIDAGVDELYYDWAIGGTGEVINLFNEIRGIAKGKGRNIAIYGNCKGNILVDLVCDITKSEGTTEAGVWDGKWVHNVAQSKFYYAAGDFWKPYRSKYEGADPGVANPGAYDIRDDMKYGWKRPIAEAAAFHSHFAIAETGSKLRDGWIAKNNDLAMEIWNGICRYNNFLADNEDLYRDYVTVSKVGLLAPPVIPSFETSLTRGTFYNMLAEMNVMYDVLLLPRISEEMLSKYEVVIIPDVPWVTSEQLAVLQNYVKNGGKVFTVGSSKELRALATITAPASLTQQVMEKAHKMNFLKDLQKLYGDPLIVIQNGPYVISNIVKKQSSDKIIIHFVNYEKNLDNIKVTLNLGDFVQSVDSNSLLLLSPDDVEKTLKNIKVTGKKVEFTMPALEIYNVVTIN